MGRKELKADLLRRIKYRLVDWAPDARILIENSAPETNMDWNLQPKGHGKVMLYAADWNRAFDEIFNDPSWPYYIPDEERL